MAVPPMLPPDQHAEGSSMDMISGLNPGLRYLLPTLHERRRRRPCKARFRLAGCAFAGRASNPLERIERFQVISVGVTRQYCGQLGKQDNCQVAVSLSAATHQASLPVAWRLYLAKDWADDPVRWAVAGVPAELGFQTKPEIALRQMRQALANGVPPAVALADPAYGNDSKFRAGITELGLPYAVGILPGTAVWCPGEAPLPPAASSGRGRPAKRLRRDATHRPVSVKALAMELAPDDWQEIAWREGSNTALSSRFARLRVRPAHGDATRSEPAAEEWLLIEWPEGETEPDHYWLCTLPADIAFERTVDLTNPRIIRGALADRTRLSRTQAGSRARPLRRPRMARLSPPRKSLHRSPRVPDLREGDDSPLRTCPFHGRLATKRKRWGVRCRICRCISEAPSWGWGPPRDIALAAGTPGASPRAIVRRPLGR